MNREALDTSVILNNGVKMPILGLGVWEMSAEETTRAVSEALKAGYRHIDTAKLYGNEKEVGEAVKKSGVPREEIFVTTKLWPTDFFDPRKAFERSLSRLDLGYVDLYLIHWPAPIMPQSIWRSLETVYDEKLARSIGVSNYGISHLEDVLSYAKVPPAVNQVKFSPFDRKKDLLEYCRGKQIALEAYSPLTRGKKLSDPRLRAIAEEYHKTPAQILIRWCIEKNVVVIPKSTHKERIIENAGVFDFTISPENMRLLDDLS